MNASSSSSLFGNARRRAVRAVRRAFTLVEILIVIAILGMLVGVLVKNVDGIFGGSQVDTTRIFVNETLRVSFTRYRLDLGDYPTTAEGLQALVTPPAARAERWRGPYMDTPGGRMPVDPWGEPYQYRYPGTRNKTGYDLFSKGPDKTVDTDDDIGNW